LIVVDTGSTDDTSDIAQSCGARVLNFPWCDDFSAARNEGLKVARGRWILVLDADEYLPEASINALQALIDGPADRAYHLLNKSSSDGGKTGMVGKIVRLFPNRPEIRFEWPVHEQVVTSLNRAGVPIHDTSIEIIHTGYSSPEINAAKQERNLHILEKITASDPDPHPMALFLQGGALLDLGRISEALDFTGAAPITRRRPGEWRMAPAFEWPHVSPPSKGRRTFLPCFRPSLPPTGTRKCFFMSARP
jgi:hypothetical protein